MTHDNDNHGSATLTSEDAVQVWLLHWAGKFQHHIAAKFGVNPGRVSEVLKEKKHIVACRLHGPTDASCSHLEARMFVITGIRARSLFDLIGGPLCRIAV